VFTSSLFFILEGKADGEHETRKPVTLVLVNLARLGLVTKETRAIAAFNLL
jgi:hypothetical protein